MTDRFEKIYELPGCLYAEGAPVFLEAGVLLKDSHTGNLLVQLKFHSVSEKVISAAKVSIQAFDVAGDRLKGVQNYQYLDLNVRTGEQFGAGKAIILPDITSRKFNLAEVAVLFSDGTEYVVSTDLVELPTRDALVEVLENVELRKQYEIMIGQSAVYVPQEFLDLWVCTCGEWNRGTICAKCKASKEHIMSAYNIPALTESMETRLAEEIEKGQIITEEKNWALDFRAAKVKRKKIILSSIVVAVIALIALFAIDSGTRMSIDETEQEIVGLLNYCTRKIDVYNEFLDEMNYAYTYSSVLALDIEEYEKMWSDITEEIEEELSIVEDKRPCREYKQEWKYACSFARELVAITEALSDWDTNSDGAYSEEEIVNLVNSGIDSLIEAQDTYLNPIQDGM